jgi:hypothetical protein
MALFVLLVISSPVTTTANEVQVVQRDISTTIPPSDKNIPHHEKTLQSCKLADDSISVFSPLLMW